jgi:CheY-like chemotaxis protein
VGDHQVEVHFAIRDTGIGISQEHRRQLFQPFSQADASNTRWYGGAGLGLVISKRLCEMMGGSIWVESEVNVGSTFHFTIVATGVETPGREDLYAAHPALEGRAALIIDDNPVVCQVLQQILSAWGMIPTRAASGAEALALIRKPTHFDIVIIDMQMPGMSGLALAKDLRRLVAELPILMTSSLGVPMYAAGDNRHLYDLPIVVPPTPGAHDQHEAVRQLGVKCIVFKPVKPLVLRAALLEHLDTTKSSSVKSTAGEPRKSNESIDADMGRRHPLRILLAEDNFTNQKVALRMLMRLGYEADLAVNGLEVIKALQLQSYDVILMDVQMPEMDGLEATRQIRTDLAPSLQPYIIAMTAAAMQLDREKCLEAGMDDFLAKPTRLEDLAQALKRYFPLSASAG